MNLTAGGQLTVAEWSAEIARLRSIVHRAESHLLSYDTRGAITILRELNEGEDEGER